MAFKSNVPDYLNKIAQDLIDMEGNFSYLKSSSDIHGLNISNLQPRMTAAESAINSCESTITTLSGLISDNTIQIGINETNISNINTEISNIQGDIASLQLITGGHTSDIGSLQLITSSNTSDIGSIQLRVDSLESSASLPMKLGDATNFTRFGTNGFQDMAGDAMYWDDFPPNPIVRSRQPSANNPTLATFVGNIEQYTFAVDDYVSDNFEILHGYKEGTDFDFHIHWATNGSEASDKYVKWEVEIAIANGTEEFTTLPLISEEVMIPSGTADRTHFSTTLGFVTGTNVEIGSLICYNIKRITSSGTAVAANPFGLQCGIHAIRDTLGSRGRLVK